MRPTPILLSLILLGLLTFTGCNKSDAGAGMTTTAVLRGTGLARANFFTPANLLDRAWLPRPQFGRVAATLNNVTGKADSLAVLTTENNCAFVAWAAESQRGPIATANRSIEAFDLGDPVSWTSTGSGIRDICSGGTITGIEAYFGYMDLDITVSSTNYIVRIAMGKVGNYEAGDVLVKVSDVFNWIDSGSTALTPETSTRPATPYQYAAISDFEPFVDGGQSVETVLDKVAMSVDDATKAITLDNKTSKVVVTVDFTTASLTVTDPTSAATVAKTLAVQFLDDYSQFSATVTALKDEEKGTSADPVPEIGNGEESSTAGARSVSL